MDLAVAFSGFTAAVTLRRARSDSAKRALARWRHPVLLGALQAWVGAVDCVKWEAAEAQRAKELESLEVLFAREARAAMLAAPVPCVCDHLDLAECGAPHRGSCLPAAARSVLPSDIARGGTGAA
jgi:hypothetical protein